MTPLLLLGVFILVVASPIEAQNGFYNHHAVAMSLDIPPPGMSSLTFVFDRTGSMNDDLVQVRHGAKSIFETVMKQRKKLIYNYVLVAFHDPDVDPPFVTTDPDVFQQELASITVQGGGDCPEMSLTGITKALEVSLPGSYIYVFTDARAKDYHLEERILNLIQEKHSSVVFVLTGDCGNRTAPGYRTYEKIAAASFGQVFHLEKSHVNTVLEYVRHTIEQRKIHMLYEVREHGQVVISPVAVDGLMTELTISLSGVRDDSEFLNITLIDPEGQTVDKARYENQAGTIDLKNVKLIRVKDPEPGVWKVRTTSKNKHTLRIFGHSTIDFKYGFSTRVVDSIDLAHPRPIANQLTYLMVNMTGLDPPGLLMQVALVDYNGRILYTNESRIHKQNSNLYYVGPFMPPKGYFFVRVQGEDDAGYEFIRISSTAISTVDATGPRAYMADRTTTTAFQSANLTCSVESVSPYTVYWKFGNDIIGGPLFYQHTDTAIWTIDSVTAQNRGYYSCVVVSSAGNHTAITYLDAREPPPHITAARNQSVILRETAFLHCRTQSNEEPRILWERKDVVVGNSAKVYQYPNGTLRILDTQRNDAGFYVCKATTSGGTDKAHVYLNVYELPEITVQPNILFVAPGQSFTLTCDVKGEPKPESTWFFRGTQVVPDKYHYFFGSNGLIVNNVNEQNIGVYECRASNRAGIAVDYANVQLAVPPLVQVSKDKEMIGRGEQVVLTCHLMKGTPKPQFKWLKNGRELHSHSGLSIHEGRLLIQNAQDSDAGEYRCQAENSAGTDSQTIKLDVGIRPQIINFPDRLQTEIENSLTIQCNTKGAPRPQIYWKKDRKLIDQPDEHYTILPDKSLLIKSVRIEDQGYFSCEAKNEFGVDVRNTLLEIINLVSPVLAASPTEMDLIEGKDLIINCIVMLGNPKPTTKWFKNGVEISNQPDGHTEVRNDGSLILRNGLAEQQGEYTCKAESVAGNAFLNVNVRLITKPKIVGHDLPTIYTARSGDSIDLKCPIESYDQAKVIWMLGTETLNINAPTYSILADNTLRIYNADQIHAGDYTCIVRNQAGDTRYTTKLQVQTPPIISPAQSSFNTIEGDTITLECYVEAEPAAEVKWYLNDQLIEHPNIEAGTNDLNLDDIKESDRGIYKCVATNPIGSDERTVMVTIHTAPIIDSAGLVKSRNAVVNETITLECPARASPPPERQWFYEGTQIYARNMNDMSVSLNPDGSLVIRNVQLIHAGNYECKVSNLAGDDQIVYSLHVQSGAKIRTPLPPETDAIVGISIVLNCRAHGIPEPTILWEKDGLGLALNNPNYQVTQTGTLRIKQPSPSDSGVYKCTAQNIVGWDTTETVLTIKAPPSIKASQKSKYQLIENSVGVLQCQFEGSPTPKVEWMFEDQRLSELVNDYKIFPNGTLHIFNVQTSHAGLFTCTLSNEAGKTDTTISVDVLAKPKISEAEKPEIFTVNENTSFVLYCPVASNVDFQIEWRWNGRPITDNQLSGISIKNDKRRLVFNRVQITDSGNFECVVQNAAGQASKKFLVNVDAIPTIDLTMNKNFAVKEGERVELVCPASGTPQPNITWIPAFAFTVDDDPKWQPVSVGSTLVIEEAQLRHAGMYVCVATNRAGFLDIPVRLDVWALPKIIQSSVESVMIGKPVTLNCDIENDDISTSVKWLYNAQEILPQNVQITKEGRRLIIHSTSEADQGLFTCVVKNKIGESTQDFPLEITVPPQLINNEPMTELTLIDGQQETLHCNVHGSPMPTIQWYKDGIALPDSNDKSTIIIKSTGESDPSAKSRYSCVVSNKAGTVNKDFYVQSIFTPKLATLGENERLVEVFSGNTASFQCPVQNQQPDQFEIIWLQHGRPINIDSKHFATSHDRTRLSVLDIRDGDAGSYQCIVRNRAGEAKAQFELKVLVAPMLSGDPEQVVELIEGEELDLECIYTGLPTPTATWYKNNHAIDSHIRLINNNQFLYTEKVKKSDEGLYSCKVQNAVGTTTKQFDVKVIERPRLIATVPETSHVGVPVEQSLIMECSIKVDPLTPTEFVWLKNGQYLSQLYPKPENKIKMLENGRKLHILYANEDDTGHYSCIAKNRAGEVKKDYELLVKVPPSISSESKDFTVIENGSLVIQCIVSGIPKPQISWIFGNQPISNDLNAQVHTIGDGNQLRIGMAKPSHAGLYICKQVFNCLSKDLFKFRATNELGTSEASFQVAIIQRPDFSDTSKTILQYNIGQTASIDCPIKHRTLGEKVTWLFNDKPIDLNDPHYSLLKNKEKLMINSVRIEDRGTYSCQVVNDAGENRKEFAVDVLVPPAISLLARDKRLAIIEYGTLLLDCPASGNPEPKITWRKDGIELNPQNIGFLVSGATLVGSSSIRISNIQQDTGSGIFTCEATNSAGSDFADIEVEVITKPKIKRENTTSFVDAEIGGRAEIECLVEGQPVTVSWLKNNNPLVTSDPSFQFYTTHNHQRLNFVNLKKEDAAKYTCVAKNSAGEDRRDIELRFLEAPRIDTSNVPPEQVYVLNQSITLDCPAVGEPDPTIVWIRDGDVLGVIDGQEQHHDKRFIFVAGGRQLKIEHAKFQDAGRYSCVATNAAGAADFDINVKVIDKPIILGSAHQEVYTILNQREILNCTVANSSVPIEIEWQRFGEIIGSTNGVTKLSELIQISERGQILHILSAQRSDAVTWSCIAKNLAGEAKKDFHVVVQVKPTIDDFKSSPAIINSVHGAKLEINCVVDASPEAVINWYKGKTVLKQSSKYDFRSNYQTLVISDANSDDDGKYICEATNPVGMMTKSFILKLAGPPVISVDYEEIRSNLGDSILLDCTPQTDNGPFTTNWYFNNKELNEDQKLTIDNTRLLLNYAQLNMSGDYKCIVENSAGSAIKTFKFTVQKRPVFTDQSGTNPTIIVGRSLILDCTVEGVPQPIVTWRKDGEILTGSPSHEFINNHQQLYIDQAKEKDAGLYTCIGQNDQGTESKNIFVTVLEPPMMTTKFTEVELKENETITLKCPVKNPAFVEMEWLQDGQPIEESTHFHQTEDGQNLHLINIQKRHRGAYTCLAQNEAGTDESKFQVVVLAPPIIRYPAPNARQISVLANQTLELKCQADGVHLPEIHWQFEGSTFATSHGESLIALNNVETEFLLNEGSATVKIANVSSKHQGRYTCLAINSAGRTSADIFVQVMEPPRLHTPSPHVRVVQGREFSLHCQVLSGLRPMNASWQKGDQTMTTLIERADDTITYYIHNSNAQLSDAGNYLCLVENKAGRSQLSIKVEVLVPPKIGIGERLLSVVEGGKLALDCDAQGSLPLKVSWYFGSQLLERDGTNRYQLTNANASMSGKYSCEATNAVGTATADFYLEVLIKPKIKPYEKVVRVLENAKAKLECKFEGNPEPTVKWTRNGRPIEEQPHILLSPLGETLMIPKANRTDAGDYSCFVSNDAGSVEAPFILVVQTAPHIEEPIEQNPQAIESTSVILNCPVLGLPQPKVTWRYKENDLVLSSGGKYRLDGKNNLKIINTTTEDKGRYVCVAENELGTLPTDFELEILAAPKSGPTGQRAYQTHENTSVTLECPVDGSYPIPTIEWLKGEEQLFSEKNIQISPNSKKLKINKPTLSDAGKYTCRATNAAGSTDIDLTLKVIVPPKIDDSNLIKTPLAILDRSIYLECPSYAVPSPTIQWLKDGKPIEYGNMSNPDSSKFSLQQANQTFGIRNVEHQDKATYTCVVTNDAGSISQDFDVEVLTPPVMESKETKHEVKREGDSITLICPIKSAFDKDGISDLSISWSHEGRPLNASTKNLEISPDGKRLKINDIRVANAGHFKCIATNRAGQSHAKFDVEVLSVPVIEEERASVDPNVPLGLATTLWCPVSGHPKPTVKWYKKNGEQVIDVPGKIRLLDGGQGLEINEAGLEDIGTWTCKAENSAGVTEKAIKLNVFVAPTVKVEAENGNSIVSAGKSVVLFCNATGNPKPALAWNFNGQLLIPSAETYQISLSGGRLDIVSLKEEHTGNYSCIAQNEMGKAEATIAIDILVAPQINRENVELNRKLPTGRSTTLFCDAHGKPPPKITWYFNNTVITEKFTNIVMGTDNKYIQITNVTLDDKGIYRCAIDNSAGNATLDYIITVNLAPSIVSSGTTKVTEKGIAVLKCDATGEPKPKTVWQRNGIRLETGLRYFVEDTGSLKIIDAQSSDSGIYVCVATNEAGTDQQAFTLEVLVVPTVVKASDNETIIAVGSEFSLVCEAAGYPYPSVKWSYNEEPIEKALADGSYTISDEGTLTVKGLMEKGDLPFTCTVENEAGQDMRNYIVKAISAPTRVGPDEKRQLNSTQGEPTIIICEIPIEDPKSKIIWRKNGEIVNSPDVKLSVENKKGYLKIMDTTMNDEGVYECTVTNSIGNASEKTEVFVGVAPKISNQSRSVIVKRGERAQLWCETVGIPTPKLAWYRDNVPVAKEFVFQDEDRRLAAIFDDVQMEHAGVYTCIASNWVGNDSKDLSLVVLTPPIVIPQQVDVNASLGDTVILSCNATGNPEPVVSWVKVPNLDLAGREEKYQLLGTSLAIKNVTINDDDFYHCVAKSDAGQTIGIRRITINNVQLEGPPRIWVECDSDGKPAQRSYVPPRGDSPDKINPMDIEYLPWEDRHAYSDRQGPKIVYYKCVPSTRDQRSQNSATPIDTMPQLIEQPPRMIKHKQGEPLKLKCSATGSPQPMIIWMNSEGILHESHDGNLQLAGNDDRLREGNYTCIARNSAGEQRSIVNVEFSDTQTTSSPAALLPVTILNCPDDVPLDAEVYWEVDGQRIEPNVINDRMHVLANGSLVLSYFAEGAELKEFKCVHVNDQKEERRLNSKLEVYMQLDEQAPRVDIPQPTIIEGQINKSIVIDCLLIEGTPLTTRIRWTKDNVNLDVEREHYFVLPNNTLIINKLTEFDRGSYKCRAWNKKGKSFDETSLITGNLPTIIEARIHGRINGILIPPQTIRFASLKPNVASNEILAKLQSLPPPLGKNAGQIENKLVGLMATPMLQTAFDPDRLSGDPNPRATAFDRKTNYEFESGEKIKVEQKSAGVKPGDKILHLDVEFNGDLPKAKNESVKIETTTIEMISKTPGQLVGKGISSLRFGDQGHIPFKFEDQIDYSNTNPNNSLVRPGSTLRIQAETGSPKNATNKNDMKLEVSSTRLANCPNGYKKELKGCIDINECKKSTDPCSGIDGKSNAKCVNKEGGYECQQTCAQGFQIDLNGDCVDLNECTLGLYKCENGTDCLNTDGGYSCAVSCPFGYFMDETGACLDVNECLHEPCGDQMECMNLAGSYKCVCLPGLTLSADGTKCDESESGRLEPLKHLKFSTEPDAIDCPSGMQWSQSQSACIDIDECAFDAPCQYKCINKVGGYECICPENYAIDEYGQCIDIDECQMINACPKNDLCFNQLGDYECIADPCPKNYQLRLEGSDAAHCFPTCTNCTKPNIHIYLIPMPSGLPQGTPLARLAAHDTKGVVLKNTTFHEEDAHDDDEIQTNADHALDIQTDAGRAIVRLNNKLAPGTRHDLKLRSLSVTADGHHKYASNFHIYTSVSKYPF